MSDTSAASWSSSQLGFFMRGRPGPWVEASGVRLYLSSFGMGNRAEHLAGLVGADRRRVVVIANALDDAPPGARREAVEREQAALAGLGFTASELDLRDYFGLRQRLRRELADVALAWVRGGNVFLLRYALSRSGADAALRELLTRDALVYAGYSAGACVLARSLRGLELVDDPGTVMRTYGGEPLWDGLGLLGEAFVPHYQSPGHPETAAIAKVVARYQAEGVAYRALRDGQALLIHGSQITMV